MTLAILDARDKDYVVVAAGADLIASYVQQAIAAGQTAQEVLDAILAAGLSEGVFPSLAAGESGTTDGQYFWVGDAGTVVLYRNDAGVGTEIAELATAASVAGKVDAAALASTLGGTMQGLEDGHTTQALFNILKATRRPAMDGIFSSGSDQRSALLAFISNAAADGQTIEWGPLDVSLDVATATGGRRGLTVPTGSRWVFHPNTVIRAIPGAASSYEIINLWDVSDIVIEGAGARIIGERDGHVGSTGEWGQGVSLRGCSNITIRDLNVEDCWGDGFYVGVGTQNYCENVVLENLTSLRARRNGLSLISVKGFRCIDCNFSDTNGTAPQFGVDIEPNNTDEFLQGVLFERLRTGGNVGYGIGIALQALVGTSDPIDIRIVDHGDDGSASAIIGAVDTGIAGRVEILRPVSRNANGPAIVLRRKASNGPQWTLTEPTAIDWNRSASANAVTSSGIVIYAPNGDLGTEAVGNVDIIRPNILPLSSGTAANAVAIAEQRATTPDGPEKIRIIDPVNLAGLPCRVEGVATFSDPNRTSARTLADAAASITRTPYYKHNAVPALAATRYFDVANDALMAVGTEFVFELTGAGAGECRVRFAVGVSLFPDAVGANRYIGSNTKGSRLRIRKTAAAEWTITEKIGTWATG
jgi:hypothetical protein